MTTYDESPDNPGLLPYRVRQIESWRRDTDQWRRDVDEDRGDLKHMRTEVVALTKAVDDLKTILVRASITVAGSAILVLVGLLAGSGKLP